MSARIIAQLRPAGSRRGSMVVEVGSALVVLLAAMALGGQVLVASLKQQREVELQAAAAQEVANQVERIALLPWDQLTSERLAGWQVEREPLRRRAARAAVTIVPITEPAVGKQIRVELSWLNQAGQRGQPVSLQTWRFAPVGNGGAP